MITSIGTLRYRKNWWVWLEVDYELGRYLRRLYFFAQYGCSKLGRPSQDEHITIVSSHEKTDRFEAVWGVHEGREIEFTVLLKPETNSNAVWCPVRSIGLEEIRLELGLSAERHIPLHFAVGYLYPGKVKNDS